MTLCVLTKQQIDPDTRPSNIGPPFTGHFRITADTPRGLQPHQPAPNSQITAGKPHPSTDRLASTGKADLNLEIRRNIYDDKGKDVTPKVENGEALVEGLEKDGKQYFCYSCGKDCTRVRYHNSKNPAPSAANSKPSKDQRYDLCSLCFQEGRFPSSTSAADYTKLENERYRSLGDREAPWSDSELLLLLEGLEMFDDNWESVADHVGSRTREECVLKFLQLEIEDKYLEDAPTANGSAANNVANGVGAQDLAYLSGGRLPFSQFDNPVMSVMGFLAGLADPATTAKAAGRSVEEMRKTLKQRMEREATPGAEKPASSEGEGAVKGERAESMEVDDTTSLADRQPPTSAHSHDLPTTALSLTAARAAALASHTERQLTNQVSAAVNLQLAKLELKLQQFSEMEALLQAEGREIERMRQRLYLDRLAFRKKVRETEEKMGGLKIEVSSAEEPKVKAVPQQTAEGGIVGESMGGIDQAGLGDGGMGAGMGGMPGIEPYQEGMEGFMRHEI